MTSFSEAPLRAAMWLGFLACALAALGIVYAIIMRLFTTLWVTGWTALFIAVLFVGGVQLLSLGIIGEYVGRIYGETKRRPLYLVQERLGFAAPTAANDGFARAPREPDRVIPLFREPEVPRAAREREPRSETRA
jgi:dolichol-phosphate mannosyltransferase